MKCLGKRNRCTGSIKHEIIDEMFLGAFGDTWGGGDQLRSLVVDSRVKDKFNRMQKLIEAKNKRNKN